MKSLRENSMEKAVTEGFWYTTDTGDFRNDPIYVSAACFWDHSEIMPCSTLDSSWASLVAQLVKNLPAMWETWGRSLGWEDPLEKGTATHPVFWPDQRVGHD